MIRPRPRPRRAPRRRPPAAAGRRAPYFGTLAPFAGLVV
jgi:hypothetical protein